MRSIGWYRLKTEFGWAFAYWTGTYWTVHGVRLRQDFIELDPNRIDPSIDSNKRIEELEDRLAQLEQSPPIINGNPNHWAPSGITDNIIY